MRPSCGVKSAVKLAEHIYSEVVEDFPHRQTVFTIPNVSGCSSSTTASSTLFSALDFLAQLSCHIPNTCESITRDYGRDSSRRRGECSKLAPPSAEEEESEYRREFRRSAWAACIGKIYELGALECPKCKAQMRIVPFIQDSHAISNHHESSGGSRTSVLRHRTQSSSIPHRLSMSTPHTTRSTPLPLPQIKYLQKSELMFLSFA